MAVTRNFLGGVSCGASTEPIVVSFQDWKTEPCVIIVIPHIKKATFTPSSRVKIAWYIEMRRALCSSVSIDEIHLKESLGIFASSCRFYGIRILKSICSTVNWLSPQALIRLVE